MVSGFARLDVACKPPGTLPESAAAGSIVVLENVHNRYLYTSNDGTGSWHSSSQPGSVFPDAKSST